jgi:DNA-binding PadR family transcriptional regulator
MISMSNSEKKQDSSSSLLPTTYLAVLSLIGSGARYGYEINRILEERGYRNWVDIKFSSVYKGLQELEKKGLIKGKKSDTTVQPSRKTYSITAKGQRILQDQMIECLSNPPKANSLFDLGMSGLFLLTKSQSLDALNIRLQNLSEQMQFLKNNIDGIDQLDKIRTTDPDRLVGSVRAADIPSGSYMGVVKALFERPYVRLRCEHKWLRGIVKQIENDEGGFLFKSKKKRGK